MHETVDEYVLPWWSISEDLFRIIFELENCNYGNALHKAKKLKEGVDIMEKQSREAPHD